MLFIYRILINLTLVVSPIIFIYRLLKKKEDPKRFTEKLGFFYKKKKSGNLIWFHGASVGELKSIIPLVEKLEKDKKVQQILITSNTLSSSKVLKSLKLKKVIHQFFPIDSNLLIAFSILNKCIFLLLILFNGEKFFFVKEIFFLR